MAFLSNSIFSNCSNISCPDFCSRRDRWRSLFFSSRSCLNASLSHMTYQNEFLKYTSKIQNCINYQFTQRNYPCSVDISTYFIILCYRKKWSFISNSILEATKFEIILSRNQAGLVHDLGKNLICRTALAFVSRHLEEWEHLMSSSDHAAK